MLRKFSILAIATFLVASQCKASLIASYNMEPTNSETLLDSSGLGNNATIFGAASTTGINGSAMQFDGANDYCLVKSNSSLTNLNQLSIATSIKLNELGGNYRDIVHKNSQYTLRLGPSGSAYKISGAVYLDGVYHGISANWVDRISDTDTWHDLAFTYNGTEIKLFLDGSLIKTKTATGAIMTNNSDLYIGGWATEKHCFGGSINNLQIYNNAISVGSVPEPATLALLGIGGLFLRYRARRKQ